jgi:hypothetical protein
MEQAMQKQVPVTFSQMIELEQFWVRAKMMATMTGDAQVDLNNGLKTVKLSFTFALRAFVCRSVPAHNSWILKRIG